MSERLTPDQRLARELAEVERVGWKKYEAQKQTYVVTYRDHLDGETYKLEVEARSATKAMQRVHPLSKVMLVERAT